VQIEYFRKDLIRANIFKKAITSGHRWPMKSNSQKPKALMHSLRLQFNKLSLNVILTFPTFVFDYRSGQKGTTNHTNMNLYEEYLERTRRPGLLFCLLIQLQSMLGLHTRRLFGPGSTWTSSPKLVPAILLSMTKCESSRNQSLNEMHLRIRGPEKMKAQSGGEAAFPPACVIGAFIGLHGQTCILKNSDLAWVKI
jgi:hypothetical protein